MSAVELGKPLVALGTSGGLGMGLEAGGTGTGTPAGVGMLNFLAFMDSLLTWKNGLKREEEARKRGDKGGEILGKRKANQGKWGAMGGLMGTVQGGLNLGNVLEVGSKGLMSFNDLIGKGKFVSTGLGVAGAGLGIAGGAITSMQGLWKSGKAIGKLRSLSKSAPMLSPDGDRWRARIKDREKTKLGLNALKTLGGLLGITAGALVIASNPVGWALGIAGAAIVGGLFAYKLINKFRKSRKRQQTKKRLRREMMGEEPPQEQVEEPQQLLEEAQQEHENGGGEGEGGEGGGGVQVQDVDPSKLDKAKRKRAMELGNLVAQQISQSAKVAGEIRAALPVRHTPMYEDMMKGLGSGLMTYEIIRAYGDRNNGKGYPLDVRKAHDAVVLVTVLNLTPEQVESDSGQELIEKKISATDSL
jgi:hypothetical protein